MQQTFQTGERVFISTKNISISSLDPYRTVIRGGSHIEPILYTQYGQLPGVTWNTTMSFEDIVLAPGGATSNYAASYSTSASLGITPNTTTTIPLNIKFYLGLVQIENPLLRGGLLGLVARKLNE